MLIRPLALALLIGVTQAHAAPKKHKRAPAPTQDTAATPDAIDVDAMARAKDAAASTDNVPAASANSGSTDIPATPKEEPAPASAEQASVAPTTEPAEKSTTDTAAGVPPMLAPTPGDDQRRIAAACEARATSLLDAAQKGDYAGATRDFDAKMRAGLPALKFKQAWESLAQFGALTARGQTHLATDDGYIAVTVPLLFEKANLYAQVACGSDGRVAGFYIKPLEMPKQ